MAIRTYRAGDEVAQVSIYNEAAADLPKFKPATLDEIRRRKVGADFDAESRFYAEIGGRVVGYAVFQRNGRVSFPWCRKGHEDQAEPLFLAVLGAMQARGMRRAFAAYRADWPTQGEFFATRGFRLAREMVNFIIEMVDMPTPAAVAPSNFSSPTPADMPAIFSLCPEALRAGSVEELERHLLHNAYFQFDSVFVVRGRAGDPPLAVGLVVHSPGYADARQIDSNMPCFRLGALGTEGMSVKRVNGLFSFLARPGKDANPLGLSLMSEAAHRLSETDLDTLAAQVPSDVPHLLRFYQQFFRRQGSFPVFEREL
jgi:hypothetical protein